MGSGGWAALGSCRRRSGPRRSASCPSANRGVPGRSTSASPLRASDPDFESPTPKGSRRLVHHPANCVCQIPSVAPWRPRPLYCVSSNSLFFNVFADFARDLQPMRRLEVLDRPCRLRRLASPELSWHRSPGSYSTAVARRLPRPPGQARRCFTGKTSFRSLQAEHAPLSRCSG